MVAALVGLSLASVAIGWGGRGQAAIVIWVIGFFLLRNLYWAYFELTPRAATPAKRLLGLRVAARDGGRLGADAILARNLLREIELFLPITIVALQPLRGNLLLILLGLGWTGIFMFFPLFNRDRLRVGDLLAGTWVVLTPKRQLLQDIAAQSGTGLSFTRTQLAAYGIKELHVLEDVLRNRHGETIAAVAERIRTKIVWQRGPETDEAFLTSYYAGLRGELERGLLFGRSRRDKFDGVPSEPSTTTN
jgi:uncharacterized RDD family membrane protein YckC